jgi:elongation factor P
MYGITELKKGTLIELEGTPFQVVDYSQKVMGRGGSIVNVRIKSLKDGRVLDKTFKGSEKISAAEIERKSAQFLYTDETAAHFMDKKTYEQFAISKEAVGDALKFLPEGAEATVQLFDSRPIGVELPVKVKLKVVQAPDVVKGDTQSTVQKQVELETGTIISAPIFVKAGDMLVVDTRAGGRYVERAKA